jgi:hypothetical protein
MKIVLTYFFYIATIAIPVAILATVVVAMLGRLQDHFAPEPVGHKDVQHKY